MLDYQLFQKLNKPIPRYTSYPTAPNWEDLENSSFEERLKDLPDDLSLYFHLPFCETMCLFCGCSVILNRKEEKEKRYVETLFQEIELATTLMGKKKRVPQLHFGGGTPTKLSCELLEKLFRKIENSFELDFSKEIAIEIDPRTVFKDSGEKLAFLRNLGFNRVSFGVQDTDERVQEAIRRRQSLEVTLKTFFLAKELGFHEINIDLIYGLPYQTKMSFKKTVSDILSLKPDRIALFSYAKVPWLKAHQKAIPDKTLPTPLEKFEIYVHARQTLIENGYVAIGMDHFALKDNELTKSYRNKALHRNFQGYTVKRTETLLGLGVTAISDLETLYSQNKKDLNEYEKDLSMGRLPFLRGKILSEEDRLRKWVINSLMCRFEVNKREFSLHFSKEFDHCFEEAQIKEFEVQGLVMNEKEKLVVTPLGELFVRNIASLFDSYLTQEKVQFSQSV